MEKEQLVTPTQFAAELDISVATAYKMMREGKLEVVKKRKGVRHISYIPRSEVDRYKRT